MVSEGAPVGRTRAWSDDDLRRAVATSRSVSQVVRTLRAAGGAGYDAVKRRMMVLDLDTSHFVTRFGPPGDAVDPRRWTDDELAAAVASSTSLNQVFSTLGLSVGGSQWLALRDRIAFLGLDTSHWSARLRTPRPTREITRDELADALSESRSLAEVCRRLDIRGGGGQGRLVRRIRGEGFDIRHLEGQGWAKGRVNPGKRQRKPLEEVLVAGRAVAQTSALRRRLVEEGVKEARCESCGRDSWLDGPIPLELDHINGDRRDNRLENLRLLCPNCHALTETYRGRNIGRYDPDPGQRR